MTERTKSLYESKYPNLNYKNFSTSFKEFSYTKNEGAMKRNVSMLFLSIGLLLVTTVGCAAQQSSAEQSQERRQQRKESQAMGKMSMDEMMKECKEHHQSAMKSIDRMTKMMDGAKQSNDPAKMRSALDQSQKQLGEMKEHMTMCGNMMNMMEKMHGMGGMMQGESK